MSLGYIFHMYCRSVVAAMNTTVSMSVSMILLSRVFLQTNLLNRLKKNCLLGASSPLRSIHFTACLWYPPVIAELGLHVEGAKFPCCAGPYRSVWPGALGADIYWPLRQAHVYWSISTWGCPKLNTSVNSRKNCSPQNPCSFKSIMKR